MPKGPKRKSCSRIPNQSGMLETMVSSEQGSLPGQHALNAPSSGYKNAGLAKNKSFSDCH